VLTLVQVRRPAEQQVLLGLKKRGFGAGKYNGFGGKLEAGETLEEGAVRELQEESCLRVASKDLRWCGTLTYVYDTLPKYLEVHLFDVDTWRGQPADTEEMECEWFVHDDIPLDKMWADDFHWLLPYLNGKLSVPFSARFRFKGHEGADSNIILEQSVRPLGPTSSLGSAASAGALIVSTVSFLLSPGDARPLESFLRYHLIKGFAHIFLIIDSPDDVRAISASRMFPRARVSVRIRGVGLLEEQEARCVSFSRLRPLHDSDVSARQMLDAELAMTYAPELSCMWVLCLDSDELFFTHADSVLPHFASLSDRGIDQMTYLNHEGVPQVEDTVDYFSTITLFKKHHFAVPLTAEARQGLNFWMDRSRRKQYMLFYDNGKSACRAVVGAAPQSQHLWRLPPGHRSCTALADARNLIVENYTDCSDPCILHFPVCGLGWLTGKYTTLGSFPDAWLGNIKVPQSFHTDARDEGLRGGAPALEALFRREVLLDDAEEVVRQLDAGVCMRITGHTSILEATQDPSIDVAAPTPRKVDKVVERSSGPVGVEKGWILSKSLGFL